MERSDSWLIICLPEARGDESEIEFSLDVPIDFVSEVAPLCFETEDLIVFERLKLDEDVLPLILSTPPLICFDVFFLPK